MMLFGLICTGLIALAIAIVVRPLLGTARSRVGRRTGSQLWTIAVVALGFPLTSLLLYNRIGDPAALAAMTERQVAQGPPPMVLKAIEGARSQPQNFDAQLQAADLYYEIQRYDEALTFLRNANRLRPDDVETTIRLGIVSMEAGQIDSAAEWLKSASAKQPDNIAVLEAYCLVLLHEGDRTDAERTLARLATIDPNNQDLPRLRSALNNPKP
jgi:cytochrome c-type biogenesis protein CcmH/NrfG